MNIYTHVHEPCARLLGLSILGGTRVPALHATSTAQRPDDTALCRGKLFGLCPHPLLVIHSVLTERGKKVWTKHNFAEISFCSFFNF